MFVLFVIRSGILPRLRGFRGMDWGCKGEGSYKYNRELFYWGGRLLFGLALH